MKGVEKEHGSLLDTDITSDFLGGKRGIHIRLPSSYRSQPNHRYPVLYLHDGQNVFSSAGPDAAFGWGSWELDLTSDTLCREGKMHEVIMVAVDNSPARLDEYGGRHHAQGESSSTAFEKYEAFLIKELKPWVDHEYRTAQEAAHTAVMGSSMGGMCSLVLAWDHPEVFGGVASLSGAFSILHPNFIDDVLGNYHGPPKSFRVYIDSGVVNTSGGDDGRTRTEQVASELRRIGWTPKNLCWFVDERILSQDDLSKTDLRREKWAEAQTSQHNEFYWRLRSWRALTFLFPLNPT